MALFRRASLIFMLLLGGCAGFFPFSGAQSACPMQVWNQQVDQLPSPAYPATRVTGDEHLLLGIVRDAGSCQPISDAVVMFDMTNSAGEYNGSQQGTTTTNALGLFVIQSNRPGAYGGGVPHIHLFVGAPGYNTLTVGHDVVGETSLGWVAISLTRSGENDG